MATTVEITKAQEMRDMADVLDSLPDLPPLYIMFNSHGGASIQVPEHLPLTDAERMAVADQLADALGVECGVKFADKKSGTWTYGTAYSVQPEIYAPKISNELAP